MHKIKNFEEEILKDDIEALNKRFNDIKKAIIAGFLKPSTGILRLILIERRISELEHK